MKKSIPLLIIIGIAAALCAAVLVTSLRSDRKVIEPAQPASAAEVLVLVADRDMTAMTVLTADDVGTGRVSADRAPRKHLGHTIEAVGKVLAVPVRKGQALTEDLFITEGTGVHLASTLRKGMRAMSISLADYSGLEGLLYPGAIVDVLATFRRPTANSSRTEPVSASLMRGVMVLAVGSQSVVSDGEEMPGLAKLQRGRRRMVTLMIAPKQAEILQLAMEHGTVSLAMRNPLDGSRTAGGLTAMAELHGSQSETPMAMAMAMMPPEPGETPESAPMWNVTIIRGGVAEVRQFAPVAGTDSGGLMTSR